MPLFTISYDLNKPGQNYQPLYDELARIGAKRVLLSDWIVRTESTVITLRDHFRQFIDSNDRLLVVQVETWASWKAMVDINSV
jgi:hypothetical protein